MFCFIVNFFQQWYLFRRYATMLSNHWNGCLSNCSVVTAHYIFLFSDEIGTKAQRYKTKLYEIYILNYLTVMINATFYSDFKHLPHLIHVVPKSCHFSSKSRQANFSSIYFWIVIIQRIRLISIIPTIRKFQSFMCEW